MVPVYIAEVAPAAIRGRLMVLFQLMVAIGQLLAYLCGWLFAGSGGWRIMSAASTPGKTDTLMVRLLALC
ncbi:hypothetical protein STENM223S_04890 [Streptomyces tendae]